MKNLRFNLSRMLLVFAFGLIPYYSIAQDVKLSKQEKKDLEQAVLQANFGAIDTLLDRKTFVLEADYLQDRYGYQVPVNSDINFILVDIKKVVLQTGNNFNSGYNGVGGVTAEGNIQNFKVQKNFKNLSYTISFSVMTNVGIYDVFMNIFSDGRAKATISGSYGGRLSWSGDFKNLYDTRAYKGQETYLR
jgi:hypothetical protein